MEITLIIRFHSSVNVALVLFTPLRFRPGVMTGVTETGHPAGLFCDCTQFCCPVIPIFFCPYSDRGDWVQGATTLGYPRVRPYRTYSTATVLLIESLSWEPFWHYAKGQSISCPQTQSGFSRWGYGTHIASILFEYFRDTTTDTPPPWIPGFRPYEQPFTKVTIRQAQSGIKIRQCRLLPGPLLPRSVRSL